MEASGSSSRRNLASGNASSQIRCTNPIRDAPPVTTTADGVQSWACSRSLDSAKQPSKGIDPAFLAESG